MPKLVVDVILPAVHDCREKLSEEAAEIKEQMVKQVTRLHELREKRLYDTGMSVSLDREIHGSNVLYQPTSMVG